MDNGYKLELERCPFCGEEAILAENTNSEELFVECCNCYAHTGLYCSEQEAIDAWNNRVQPTQPTFTPNELDAIRRMFAERYPRTRELSEIEQSIIDNCKKALKGGAE